MFNSAIDRGLETGDKFGFRSVRSHDRRTRVPLRILASGWIDEYGNAAGTSQIDDSPTDVRRADALVVVLETDHRRSFQRGFESLDDAGFDLLAQRLAGFEVESEHLLRMAMLGEPDQTSLDRRGPACILDQAGDTTTGVGKSITKFGPLLIGTGYSDEVDFGTQGTKAGGHVAGTTRHARDVTMTSCGQYRHGSLGAHPFRCAADLLIEHEVGLSPDAIN